MAITIDPEFEALNGDLRSEEAAQLEANLVRDGCLDPLRVWLIDGKRILVDGHHRFHICERLGIPYKVVEISFKDRDAVLLWIAEHQEGRRNWTESAFAYNLGKIYEQRKVQGARTDLLMTSGQNDQKSLTAAEQIAEEKGVAEKTVRRAAEYARAVDEIGRVCPRAKTAILAETVKLTRDDAIDLARYPGALEAFTQDDVSPGQIRQRLRHERKLERFGALIEQGTPGPGEDWGRFSVVYADPPWAYTLENPSIAASDSFMTMELNELVALWKDSLKLDDHLASDAVLFLWATAPNRPMADEFIKAVGFTYRTDMVWVKKRSVFGSYTFGAHEYLLIATRGSMTPVWKPRSFFEGEPWMRLHSAKPDHAYEIIERMYPELSKLELFARRYRAGWTSWGNELGRYEQTVELAADDEGDAA